MGLNRATDTIMGGGTDVILVTGGAGFTGANFVLDWLATVLGDNIFYGQDFAKTLRWAAAGRAGDLCLRIRCWLRSDIGWLGSMRFARALKRVWSDRDTSTVLWNEN